MSTVKIKTEPTETTVDVKVKLEPSLSTADIKLEQHSSDIDAKSESDSEDYVKPENDDSDVDNDQNQTTAAPKKQRQLICKHPECSRSFTSSGGLSMHRHEHKLQTEFYLHGRNYALTRQSLNDRWLCPIPGCTSTYNAVNGIRFHIQKTHGNTIKHQQSPSQIIKYKFYYFDVDNFYVNRIRCGYHTTIGVFICHDCRLVPECLLTHLQQQHGYDEQSIDSSVLPESAVNANVDPNINQHTSNSHLTSAIREPHWQQHPDIIQGWACIISNCNYCSHTAQSKIDHKKSIHKGKQLLTVPALVLRVFYSKVSTSCFLITRLDSITNNAIKSTNSTGQDNNECYDDDGDELVLSDYSDEDDIN